MTQINPEVWRQRKESERETDTHPCDDPLPELCMCKGACGCHWKKEQPVSEFLAAVSTGLLQLIHSWESVASEFRARAEKSKTADGRPNPEVCRAIAVGLEQCARDLRKAIGAPMAGDMIGR